MSTKREENQIEICQNVLSLEEQIRQYTSIQLCLCMWVFR